MKEKYKPLFKRISLPNGVELKSRIGMPPMLIFGSDKNGNISDEDIMYMKRRADVGSFLIAGSHSISKQGIGECGQIGIFDDNHVTGLKDYVKAMKSKGNLAIAQLQHAGLNARYSNERFRYTLAPSSFEFPFISYIPRKMTEENIWTAIREFGDATRRAIAAGYDGVEIHGASHYLIQEFFSKNTNFRTDKWGGSIENRMRFALEVVKEVKRAASIYGNRTFIIGYRVSPEEFHGPEAIGYSVEETQQLIDKIVELGIDYIHTSIVDGTGLKAKPLGPSTDASKPLNLSIRETINGRCPLIVAGGVRTADDALDALNYGDLVSIGYAALTEPDFVSFILNEKEKDIRMDIYGKQDLYLPKGFETAYNNAVFAFQTIKGFGKDK